MPDTPPAATQPVGLTVHTIDMPDTGRRTTVGRLKMLLVLAACAAPVVASYLAYFVFRPEGRSNYGTLIQPTRSLPDGVLRDPGGAPVAARALHGQWLLVVVSDAACDAVCERMLYQQRQLREMVGRERDRIDKIWIATGDAPIRPALQEALDATPATRVLRMAPEAAAAWLAPEPGRALGEHLYIVDPMGEWMMRTPVAFEPQRVKRDLDRLLRASQFWDQPGR